MTTSVPAAVRWPGYLCALVLFVLILFARGGPNPAETDAHAVTYPTTAIANGQFRTAEQDTLVPNPPGYPLLTAPLLIVFHRWVASPRWCDDKAIPTILHQGPGSLFFRTLLMPCADQIVLPGHAPLPKWYRSQAILALSGWLVLEIGAVALLRSAGRGRSIGELALVLCLAALPAASDTIVQSFHPQDLMSVGFSLAALSQAIRRRWIAVGLLFGVAFLCKQFALLPLLAVLAAAPHWRDRARMLVPAAGIVILGVAPFYLADSVDTMRALSGVYAQGAGVTRTSTALGLLGIAEVPKLELARDTPILASAGLALWAWWRARARLLEPVPLIGLAIACLATRLVFEVSILEYYFLAVGASLLVLDFVLARPPLWSVGWIVVTRYGLTSFDTRASAGWTAVAFMALSLVPLVVGVVQVRTVRPPAPNGPRGGVVRHLTPVREP
jgi:hypothetical protein